MVEREFDAASRDSLQESLEGQGFFVFQIKKRPLRFLSVRERGIGQFGGRKFLSFNQELFVLIRSGLPILQVLDTILDRMEPGKMREVLREIREKVKGGEALSEAFEKFPRFFPNLYIASIKAGERTGDLPVTIGRYIAYQKRIETIKAKIRSASFYPILLSIAVAVVLLFLMLYVVPSFTRIYSDAHVELPLVTRILIALAEGMTRWVPIWAPIAGVMGFFFIVFSRSEKGMFFLDRIKLGLPFFRHLLIDYSVSCFCRTMSTVISSGIPIVEAMRMSQRTLNNRVLEARMAQAVQKVEEGTSIASALSNTGFFPSIALRMIGAGETTGALFDMLGDVSEFYEAELERRLDRMTTMIEPLMMLTMGLLIGGIVVAMYIPIFQLAGTVS